MPEVSAEAASPRENRLSVEVGEMDWKTREMRGVWEAIQYVNRVAKNRKIPINQTVITGIHSRVMRYFAPEVAGRYRHFDVSIKGAVIQPPHWTDVRGNMLQFGDSLEERTGKLQRFLGSEADAIDVAAWAHYELVRIHPFADGNGRTARELAGLILKRNGMYPPTDWGSVGHEYINVLRESDIAGTHEPFTRFVATKELQKMEDLVRGIAKGVGERAGASRSFANLIDRMGEVRRVAEGTFVSSKK